MTDSPADRPPADIDPGRYATHIVDPRGFRQAFVREGAGGVPLVCVHGWPETKRIFWKVIEPLAAAGFEVIVPDLRGFGESDVGPDGFHDAAASAHDLHALVHDVLGHERVVLLGGDFGGPIVQDLALRHPDWVDRIVLFNSPLPYDKERMAAMASRPAREASDYFVRQGTDADALAGELATAEQRRRYIATFYTSRFWAHPGSFLEPGAPPGRFGGSAVVDFHTEPFADGAKLRASFGAYESAFDPAARQRPVDAGAQRAHACAAAVRRQRPRALPGVRPHGGGRLPPSHRPVPAPRLRSLRSLGSTARPRLGDGRVLQRSAVHTRAVTKVKS